MSASFERPRVVSVKVAPNITSSVTSRATNRAYSIISLDQRLNCLELPLATKTATQNTAT